MKVDKGVCTSNDDYFTSNPISELSSVAKFETVFATLVENKILAIKRECEQHECKKKARSLKGILLRKTNSTPADVIAIDEGNNNLDIKEAPKENCENTKNRKYFFSKCYQKTKTVDIERGQRTSENCDELVNVVILQNNNKINDLEQGLQTYQKNDANIDSQSKNVVSTVSSYNPKTNANVVIIESENPNCDKLIVGSKENAQISLSTTNNSSNIRMQLLNINYNNDESLATTIDISLPQSSVIAGNKINKNEETNATVSAPTKNISIKSDKAICDDGVSSQSSQNTSDIEFSLVSENSMNELPPKTNNAIKFNNNTNSDPIIETTINLASTVISTSNKNLRERKASSCQSTPLFGRHKYAQNEIETIKALKFNREIQSCDQKLDTSKSQTIVIAPKSNTITTTLAKHTPAVKNNICNEINSNNKKIQRHFKKLHDVSLEYEITYDDEDGKQSPHGFISSFNKLTTQKRYSPVISANIKKQPRIAIKDQQESRLATLHCTNLENANPTIDKDIEKLNATGIDESKRNNKRKSKHFILYIYMYIVLMVMLLIFRL